MLLYHVGVFAEGRVIGVTVLGLIQQSRGPRPAKKRATIVVEKKA